LIFFDRDESLDSWLIIFLCFLFYFLGSCFYAKHIERLFEINPSEKTPAHTKYDGVDFVPARHWLILFGHHFSSIAGAAPIIGPVIAISIWGWGPSIIWIVLGAVFIGGLHDFSALCMSVKRDGKSIGDIAEDVISFKAKLVFSIFILLSLILLVSVFAYLCAKTFVTDPHIILPSLGLIPVAILCGLLIYRSKKGQGIVTAIGLLLLFFLILLGEISSFPKIELRIWILLLLTYSFFASTAPVHILLQPRDYLSSYLLFFGIFIGYLSLLISHPSMKIPFYIHNSSSIWPFLFVTIACGAVSGFHSLIASGTTSKQLPNQIYAKRIGYGAMIFESALSVLALLCICAGIKDYKTLKEIFTKGGPILAFSKGFGNISYPLLKRYGLSVAVVILNAFILTTLDTATRISRYVFSEITGLKNRYASTFIIIVFAGFLSLSGKWRAIWPTFGASNQLLAAFTLLVATCWLMIRKKPAKLTLFLSIFMLFTTIFAILLQLREYFCNGQKILFFISLALIITAIFMSLEAVRALGRFYKKADRIKT